MKEKPANGRSRVLWISSAASVLILSLEGIIVLAAGWPENAEGWGNFLAGAFAPLAFVWLIAAVFIQSNELREQRAELQLTRREFELNREVLSAQVEEAKRQTAFIDVQTHRLLRADQIRSFEDELGHLEAMLKRHHDCWSFTIAGSGFAFQFETMLQAERKPYLLAIQDLLFSHILQGNSGKRLDATWQSRQPDKLEIVLAAAKSCQLSAHRLAKKDQAKAKALEIDGLVAVIQKIYDTTVPTSRKANGEPDTDEAQK